MTYSFVPVLPIVRSCLPPSSTMPTLLQSLLAACGICCVGLGLLGLFLPLLPTTPFLLLAGVCFARSSRRLETWLWEQHWAKRILSGYVSGAGMSWQDKALTLVTLWLMIGATALLAMPYVVGQVLLVGIAVCVTVFLLSRKTRW